VIFHSYVKLPEGISNNLVQLIVVLFLSLVFFPNESWLRSERALYTAVVGMSHPPSWRATLLGSSMDTPGYPPNIPNYRKVSGKND